VKPIIRQRNFFTSNEPFG